MNKLKLISSSAYASIVTIIFVVSITIWAERSVPLKSWLAGLSGHHWTSKSILSLLIYGVLTLVIYAKLAEQTEISLHRALRSLLFFTIAGVVIITAFYTGHHLGFY